MPPRTISSNSSESSSNWATWVLIGLGILIFIGSVMLLFLIGRHFYAKRQQKLTAAKNVQKRRSKKTKEKQQKASKDSIQNIIKSRNLLQQPPSTQQCSSDAAAEDINEKIKKSNEKIYKKFKAFPSSIKEITAEEGNESLKNMMEQKKEIMPPLQEVSAKGDDDDEIEEAIDVKKLNEAEKCAEKVQQIGNKKDAVTAAHADNIDTEEEDAEKKKQEKFVKDKIECVKKVKEMFEVPEWDKKHMPADCDYKLFMASSSMLRFCIMEYLKAHADQILISHGYKILDGRAEVPRTAFEWLRSSEITENDEFLKSRAWMLENWSTFKRSPSLEWSYYSNMEVPLLYMTSMKDCITESEVLDRVLRQTLQTAAEYFTVTPKKDWQLQDHPMKVLARIFEDGKTIDLAATSVSVENGEVKN